MKLLRIALIGLAVLTAASLMGAPTIQTASASDEAQADGHDELVLKSGKVIRGKLLEETDTQVRFLVRLGTIEAPTTYARSEVLEIRRGVGATKVKASEVKPGSAVTAREDRAPKKSKRTNENPTVYVLTLDGQFIGSSGLTQAPRQTVLSETPLRKAIDDALSYEPEVLVVRMEATGPGGPAAVFVAEDIGPIFEELLDDGQRVVFWIESAVGGAGLVPFVSPEIYFMSEGVMGGLGAIGDTDSGDEMVDEKLISAYLGHAEGFAIKGGYEPVLIPAMCRIENWLAVRYRGGVPEYITWEPREQDGSDWEILTDDGAGKNKDEWSFEGNDVLNLDADLAKRLRISKNTHDDLDDLIFALRIGRYYNVEYGRSEQILEDWGERVVDAIGKIQDLQEELESRGRGRRGGEAGINRQMRLLKELRGLLSTYSEVLDPDESQRAAIDVQIDALRQSLRAARERSRRR